PRPCGGPPRPCWARTACLAPGLPGAARAASSSAAPRAEEAAPAGAAPKSLEERVGALEEAQRALEVRIAEVEKLAKRKGMWQMVMQYGAGFAMWYATVWGSSLFGIYMLLEMEVVSWQDSLLPLLERAGMEGYAERVDPTMGNLIIAFIVNECVEPIRFPFVIATGAPVVNAFRRLRQGKAGPGSAQTLATMSPRSYCVSSATLATMRPRTYCVNSLPMPPSSPSPSASPSVAFVVVVVLPRFCCVNVMG
ncbi:unnamed protein product, partial [Prorocentrum cordatum]